MGKNPVTDNGDTGERSVSAREISLRTYSQKKSSQCYVSALGPRLEPGPIEVASQAPQILQPNLPY